MVLLDHLHSCWQGFYDREEPRFVLWAPVFLSLGISYYFSDTSIISIKITCIALAAALSLSIVFRYRYFIYRHFLYAMSLMILGYGLITYHTHQLQTPFLLHSYEKIHLTGIVDHIESRPSDWRITLRTIAFTNKVTPCLNKVRLVHKIKQKNMADFVPGDLVKIVATINPPKPPAFAGAYDFRQQAYYSGLSGSGFIHRPVEKIAASKVSFWQLQRHKLTHFFEHSLSAPQGSIAAALVTGERGGIPPALREAYADAGIAHILAISGLHVSIVAGIVFFVFRRLMSLWYAVALNHNIKKLAAGLAIAFTFCYMQLSGASNPAVRSFIMISLILLGIIIDRPAVTLRNVALAALTILIYMPHALVSPSFQLSFAAVVGLTATYEGLRNAGWTQKIITSKAWWMKFLSYFFGLAFSSLIATIATTPYTIYTFHRFTLVALISNLIAIPLISFAIMPLMLIFLVLACFNLSTLVALPLNLSLQAMNWIAEYTSTLPLAHMKVAMFSGFSLGIMTVGLLWILFWRSSIRWIGFILVSISILNIYYREPLPDLFISQNKSLVCYYDGQRGYINSRQKARFDRSQWQDALALVEVEKPLPDVIQHLCAWYSAKNQFKHGILIWIKNNRIKPVYSCMRPWTN